MSPVSVTLLWEEKDYPLKNNGGKSFADFSEISSVKTAVCIALLLSRRGLGKGLQKELELADVHGRSP